MNRAEQEKQMIETFIKKLDKIDREIISLRNQLVMFKDWMAQDSESKEIGESQGMEETMIE